MSTVPPKPLSGVAIIDRLDVLDHRFKAMTQTAASTAVVLSDIRDRLADISEQLRVLEERTATPLAHAPATFHNGPRVKP